MAGSIKWMVYTADDAERYAVKIDESNGEALGFDDFDAGTDAPDETLPQGLTMRGINVINSEGIRRFFKVGKTDDPHYDGTNPSVTIGGTTWQITSTRGERRVRPFAFDTAQTDGDAT